MKDRFMVYLAGPISGCSYGEATDWRQEVIDKLPEEIIGLSPMRAKDFLSETECIHSFGYPSVAHATDEAIVARDYNDVVRSDAVLINLLGAKTVSIGTMMELAWCHMIRKPVVVVLEEAGNIHEHVFVKVMSHHRAKSLDEAIKHLSTILLPVPH